MFTAICRRKCTFRGKYWEEGETYRGNAEPPDHFEITEGPKNRKKDKKEPRPDKPEPGAESEDEAAS